jgi:hypothetical protein
LVQRFLYAVVTGLEAFPPEIRASAVETASNAPAPSNLFSPSESDRNLTATGPADGNSPGVWSLSALAAVEARSPRAYLTRHLPTSGFRTLLPVYVFLGFPALFHAGNALRVFLQGLFPPQSLRPLSESVTFMVLVLLTCRPQVAPSAFDPSPSPSRLRSLRGFATVGRGVSHSSTTAALLVFRPLGSSPLRQPACLREPFPS